MSEVLGSGVEDGERDSRVVEALRAGDQGAWERLYRRVYPRLHAFLLRRVGIEHVDDVVSETMARGIAGIERFDPERSSIDGWLFGIARHVAIDHRRHAARGPSSQLVSTEDYEDADARALRQDEYRHVRQAFASLKPAEQELLELRVIAQLTTEETALVLGRRPGAIRTAQSRALAHLRRNLGRSHA